MLSECGGKDEFTSGKANLLSAKEQNLKSASLPPGLTLPAETNKVSRSCSNASSKQGKHSQDEHKSKDKKEEKKKEESFFGRFLIRRSGKKLGKKTKTEDSMLAVYRQTNKDVTDCDKKNLKLSPYEKRKDKKLEYLKRDEQVNSQASAVKHNLKIVVDDCSEILGNKSEEYISVKDQGIKVKQKVETLSESYQKHKKENDKKQQSNTDVFSNTKIQETKYSNESDIKIDNYLSFTENKTQNIILKDDQLKYIKHTKKIKSDDYVFIKSNNNVIVNVNTDEARNSFDSGTKILDIPRSGPAARQRVLPIDIPASPDFKNRKELTESSLNYTSTHKSLPVLSLSDSYQNKTDSERILDQTSTSAPSHQVFLISKIIESEEKEKQNNDNDEIFDSPVKASHHWPIIFDKNETSSLSTYQYRSKSFEDSNENNFKSLNIIEESGTKHFVPKSFSFRSKIPLTKKDLNGAVSSADKQDKVESPTSDVPLLFKSKGSMEKEIYDALDKTETVEHTDEDELRKENNVSSTIISSPVSNQLTINLNSVSETTNEMSQVSQAGKAKSHLRKSSGNVEETIVPEFLKIQLNKVNVRPHTNIVLSTSNELAENKSTERNEVKSVVDISDSKVIHVNEEVKNMDNDTTKETPTAKDTTNKSDKNSSSNNDQFRSSEYITLINSSVKHVNNISVNENNETVKVKDSMVTEQKIEKEKRLSKEEVDDLQQESVVLRRKSASFPKKEKGKDSDEPELLKVFARRSLKLKDSDAETLSQHVIVLVENSQTDNTDNMNRVNLLKNNDKENEITESETMIIKNNTSPNERLKKSISLNEAKLTSKVELINQNLVSRKTLDIIEKLNAFENNQNNIQSKQEISDDINKPVLHKDKNFHSKNTTNKDIDNKNCDTLINIVHKSSNDEVITPPLENKESEGDTYSPMFKRISQRKEEWEQRAQQALNKKTP